MPRTFEPKGYYVAISLLLLTGIVGTLFLMLGPRATAKHPGILHIGVRYLDENSLAFTRYGTSGPGASIEFIDAAGKTVYQFEGLQIGRNLVPIEPAKIPGGHYTARLSAPGYQSVELPVVIEGRMLNPVQGTTFKIGTHADYNMIGVRFEPLQDSTNIERPTSNVQLTTLKEPAASPLKQSFVVRCSMLDVH